MATAPQKRTRCKPRRRIGWLPNSWNPNGGYGLLRITQDDKHDYYFLRLIPCDYGQGFELTKLEGDCSTVYHVALNPSEGQHTCECKGFLRWQHCKHVEGLLAMAAVGRFGGRELPEGRAAA